MIDPCHSQVRGSLLRDVHFPGANIRTALTQAAMSSPIVRLSVEGTVGTRISDRDKSVMLSDKIVLRRRCGPEEAGIRNEIRSRVVAVPDSLVLVPDGGA